MLVDLNGVKSVIKNIYFGDVYLLAGQSNNQFKLHDSNTPTEYYNDNSDLLLYTVDRLEVPGEPFKSSDGWISAKKSDVGEWPALGYLFGDILTKNSNRKIGLIACYQGASLIQSWLPKGILEGTDLFVPTELRASGIRNPAYSAWNGDGMLYNGMLSKILPFALNGVVWYQGESNSGGGDSKIEVYSGILKLLVNTWRKDFYDNNLKFIIVQIHDLVSVLNNADNGWRNVQSAQEIVCNDILNTFLVKSADISETDDIHPKTKLPLAKRIADVIMNNF